jgi:hypothetical protein
MYLQEKIEGALWRQKDKLTSTVVIEDHVEILQKALKPFSINVKVDKGFTKRWVVTGSYDPKSNRTFVIFSAKNLAASNPLSEDNWLSQFFFDINCTCQHELIHKYQWVHRDPDTYTPKAFKATASGLKATRQEYLGNFDEIEAQAHDLAMEMKYYYPGVDYKKLLHLYFKIPNYRMCLPTLRNYWVTFGKDMNNPVLRRFLKRTWLWLPDIKIKHTIPEYKE